MTLARANLPIPWTHALVWGNVFFIVLPDSTKSLLTSYLVGGKKILTVTHHRRAIIFLGSATIWALDGRFQPMVWSPVPPVGPSSRVGQLERHRVILGRLGHFVFR